MKQKETKPAPSAWFCSLSSTHAKRPPTICSDLWRRGSGRGGFLSFDRAPLSGSLPAGGERERKPLCMAKGFGFGDPPKG